MAGGMNRRSFIRITGGAAVVTAMAPDYLRAAEGFDTKGVLLEACTFANRGGWVLDTQFYQQMGGNYLLAHGMGVPVEDATTEVALPSDGPWHVFVRTKDWCPGDWDAPGRFRVSVNAKQLEPVFGVEDGWGWQYGGTTEAKKGHVTVALKDMTGFDGRCDAIYFSKEKTPSLPTAPADLMAWKDAVSGRSKLKVVEEAFDVVIVGGGMTGCGAALAADSHGLKVALIQDRPLFGGNASSEIRVHTLGIHDKGAAILKKLDTEHYPNGDARAIKDQKKRDATMAASGVNCFVNNIAIGLAKRGRASLV